MCMNQATHQAVIINFRNKLFFQRIYKNVAGVYMQTDRLVIIICQYTSPRRVVYGCTYISLYMYVCTYKYNAHTCMNVCVCSCKRSLKNRRFRMYILPFCAFYRFRTVVRAWTRYVAWRVKCCHGADVGRTIKHYGRIACRRYTNHCPQN